MKHRLCAAALVSSLGLLGALSFGTPAHATVITVDDTADDPIGFGTDGDCSLREAIFASNGDVPVDTCPAGMGADTIVLGENQTYRSP